MPPDAKKASQDLGYSEKMNQAKPLLRSLIFSTVIGIASALLYGFFVKIMTDYLRVPDTLSLVLSYPLVAIPHFLATSRIAFRISISRWLTVAKYSLVGAANALITLLLGYAFSQYFQIPAHVAASFSNAIASGTTFLLYKFWVFRL